MLPKPTYAFVELSVHVVTAEFEESPVIDVASSQNCRFVKLLGVKGIENLTVVVLAVGEYPGQFTAFTSK